MMRSRVDADIRVPDRDPLRTTEAVALLTPVRFATSAIVMLGFDDTVVGPCSGCPFVERPFVHAIMAIREGFPH